jgi:hypothetical protein
MRRVGRPTRGDEPRKLIAIRLDAKGVGLDAQDCREKRAVVPVARERDLGRRDANGESGLSRKTIHARSVTKVMK